jgi:hypothetical protein
MVDSGPVVQEKPRLLGAAGLRRSAPLFPREAKFGSGDWFQEKSPRKPRGGPAGAAQSMRASAQVTVPGAVTSMIVAVSTRPNRQNKSTCSRMSVSLVTNSNSPGRILRPNRLRCVNCLALPIIIISMETIKDPYIRAHRLSDSHPPPSTFADRAFPRRASARFTEPVLKRRARVGCSGDFLPPSPPAEKATARQD